MKATARPVLSAVRCRRYATQAAEKASQQATSEGRVIRLPNGAIVAGLENHSPLSRVAIVCNAGSRFEKPDQAGICHSLRNASNLGTKNATAFGITRHLQQMGSDLTATTTREHAVLTVTCQRDRMYDSLEFLSHVGRHPAFKSWEVRDMSPTLKLDVAQYQIDPEAQMFEAIHEAAYRNTLANSLYIRPHYIGVHDHEALEQFYKQHYIPSNMAVVALGTDVDELAFQIKQRWGWGQDVPQPPPPKERAVYGGGERRIDMAHPLVHAAIVTEGASLGSKDLLPLALLQRVMGVAPGIKYSDNIGGSRISKAISEATSDPFSASAININYSDSGLFGFYACAPAASIGPVLRACAASFGAATKGGISEDDVTRAKRGLKASLHLALDEGDQSLAEIASQAMITGRLTSTDDVCAEIDRVTLSDVQDVAKRVINGKASMAAVGDLAHTPFLDQIL